MPTLKPYDTQVSAEAGIPTQLSTPNDFGAEAGARLQHGATTIGAALADVQQRQEVSDVHAQLAAKRAQWTVELANRAASAEPGDMAFASKFQDDFSADMAKGGDKYTTRAGQLAFKEGAATLASHFVASSGVYQVESAGKKALVDYQALLQNGRAALVTDPTQFDNVLKSTRDALNDPDGLYAKMPADKRYQLEAETEREMAKSAVEGYIRRDPETGAAALKSGQWDQYLKGDDRYTLERQVNIAMRAKEREQLRLDAAKEKAETKAREATADGFVKKLVADPTSVSAMDIANSNLKSTQKLEWVGPGGVLDRVMKKDNNLANDPQVFIGLWDRIHLPEGDPRRITDRDQLTPFVGRGLSVTGFNDLLTEFNGKKTPDGQIEAQLKEGLINTAKATLTRSNSITGTRDPKGEENLQRFMSYFLPEYQRQRQAGKTPVELTSPDSPDYLGKAMSQYKRPFAEVLLDAIGAPADAPAREYKSPSEVSADYKAKKITRPQAEKILRDNGWAD